MSTQRGAAPPSSGEVTRLVLLAFVSMGNAHGYRIRKAIEEAHMDSWADVQFGSIYAGLRRLTDEGLLEEAGQEQEGRGPPRTLYRITRAGRRERDRLLRELAARPRMAADPVDVALAFSRFLPVGELSELLERRAAALSDRLAQLRSYRRGARYPRPEVDAMIEDLFEHTRQRLRTEKRWTERVRERIREGAYRQTAKAPKKSEET
jgi:DNA-binding PadR family transcriptional regulator